MSEHRTREEEEGGGWVWIEQDICIFLENDIQIVKKTKEYKTVICALIQKKIGKDTVHCTVLESYYCIESTPTVEGREQRQLNELIINKIQLLHIFTII